jgi:hypothetical protein
VWIRSVFSGLRSLSRPQWLTALVVAAAVGAVAFYITRPQATLPATNLPDALRSSEIQTVLPQGAIPAVYDPTFLAADKARMPDTLYVIGIELKGEAHAYPVPYLSRVEIVDDRLGDTNIAVTW